jgi:aryl-alcohol dehydrogenase-like predicted oxidoreductase
VAIVNKRTLGRTGLSVSELALGGLFVASFASPLERAKATVSRALELGINYIDTAPTYGNSEEVLGQALAGETRPFIISTKLGGRPQPFKPQDRDCLMASIEESLRLLGRKSVDILMIHEPDRPGQYDWWSNWDEVNGPVLEVLADLKKSGVIKWTGVGGTTTHELARIISTGKFDVALIAYNYSLLYREATLEAIPAAKEKNVGVILGSPLQQGALSRRYDDQIKSGAPWLSKPRREQFRALYAYLDKLKMDIAELGLRFALSNPDVSTVLVGAGSKEEVEKNVATAAKGPLPRKIIKELDQIAAMVPFRPFEEPAGLGWMLASPGSYKGPAVAR